MQCIHFRKRSKDYKPIYWCLENNKNKIQIKLGDCSNCKKRINKEYTPIKQSTKPLKKITKKQAKVERNRFSVFTDDLTKSIESKLPKDDLHEIFGGRNRHNSIKWGLVIPLTRNEHNDQQVKHKWQIKGQEWFVNEYGRDKFMEIFKIDYIEKHKKRLG